MKKFFLSIASVALLSFATSCSSDDDNTPITQDDDGGVPIDNVLSGVMSEDRELTNDIIWRIEGRYVVPDGITLTIQEGTILQGGPGQGANASVLIVARGGTILAEGTADQPIIFTAAGDNIQLGETAGTNLDENDRGLWGGVIVLGRAPSSFEGDAPEWQIEGIPANDPNGRYGGDIPNDNSGILKYVSIRHGGTLIGEGNEINGLTLGGVGNGTVIDHIEVVANVDDGIEWFGGTVNSSNLVVWSCGDDAFDLDQAYSGTISNILGVQGDNSDHAFEIDGPEGTLEGSFTINDATLIGNLDAVNGEYADYRDGAMGATNNVYAIGFKTDSDVELDNNGVAQNFLDGKLTFSNWEITLPNGVANANDIFAEKTADGENPIILNPTFTERAADWSTAVPAGGNTVGADLSVFSWTYTMQRANLGF